jgi:exonuclease VII large subunit
LKQPPGFADFNRMSTPAKVYSLEAIDALRVALVAFIDQVRDALTELDSEMRRMLDWLQHDRPRHWKTQLRLSMDQVHEAQQALHRCLMFPIAAERPSCSEERAALKKAQARQAYCEQKIERVRQWQRSVSQELFEYKGRIAQLVRLIEIDAPQAIAMLHKIVRRLEEYQSVRAADPQAAYNDVVLVQDLWSNSNAPENQAVSAITPDADDIDAKDEASHMNCAPDGDRLQAEAPTPQSTQRE